MLKTINICKSFGDNTVLKNFTHDFSDGKVTAVLGASGCGKSTLLSILMELSLPDSGEVVGNDCKLSAVFQEDRLCENLTVSANIRLVTGKKYSKAEINSELAALGLSECSEQPVRTLSGGMKRRTALLRALLAEYEILFLDEPFKGLDTDTKQNVIEYCRRKIEGKTVVFVTHDMEECNAFADDIIRLENNNS